LNVKQPLLAVIMIIGLIFLCVIALNPDALHESAEFPSGSSGQIIISEICAKNNTIIEDDFGKHRDYIELYNPGQAINLAGYCFSDGTVYSTPLEDFYLPSESYRIVFLGKDTTGFTLSASGGSIQLINPSGQAVAQTSFPAMGADQVLLSNGSGSYVLSEVCSPGFSNDAAGAAAFRDGFETQSSSLIVNEILVSNHSVIPDENGRYADAVELYNSSELPVYISQYCITDISSNRFRYRLPEQILAPGEFMVVFCDGLNYVAPTGEIHSNFSLSVGEMLTLTGPDGSYSATEILPTADNLSLARNLAGNFVPMDASLGYSNTEDGAALCAAATLDSNLPLAVTELLLSSSGVPYLGSFQDVVEISNLSNGPVCTEGWYLSDGQDPYAYPLPKQELSPGEALVIVCSQNNTGFSLSEGEALRLTAPSMFHAPTVACGSVEAGMSIVLLEDGYGMDYPSLGYENTEDGQQRWLKDSQPQGLIISEVMSANRASLRGLYAATCDWVELHNNSSSPIELSAYALSDDADSAFPLPQKLLQPGQYQVLLLREDAPSMIDGYPALPFSLSSSGEQLYLLCGSDVVDYLAVPSLSSDISFGRTEDSIAQLKTPTPGKVNSIAAQISRTPYTTTAQGIYNGVSGIEVALFGSGTIYYTTDCARPTSKSTVYSGPISINQTTVIRAICVEEGKTPSDALDLIYVINEEDALPVISIITDPKNLWNSNDGIYVAGQGFEEGTRDRRANYFQDWEKSASISLFELDGTGFSAPCGIKIYGSNSRKQPKKSLSVLFRSRYGMSMLDYPLFGGEGVDTYESFILRAGGQDAFWSRMRDELITSMAAEHTDIAVQKYRPVVLYLNGEYWGLHYIREKISEHYIAANYNVPADTVTLTESYGSGVKSYQALLSYARNHDLSQQKYFDEISTMMDIPQYTDYVIAQICIANRDNSNIRYFTYEGGKWTWILYDTDLAFIHAGADTVLGHLKPGGGGAGSEITAVLIDALLQNEAYRETFLRRMAWQINTIWTQENIDAHIDALKAQIDPVMEKEFTRWNHRRSRWLEHISGLHRFAETRAGYLLPFIQDYFDLSKQEMREYGFEI